MTDFILRTPTERVLYVEALLACMDRGSVTAQQASRDFRDICRGGKIPTDDEVRLLERRVDGIIAAYRARTINSKVAASNLVRLIDIVAPESA